MAIEVNQATVVQWGRVVFHLDNVAFCKGFLHGRDYYEIDATVEEPQRATRLTVEEVLRQIAVSDAKTGHYRFDREAIEHLEEAQEPCFADCGIRTDMALVEVVRAMLTEYAVEMGLSEQQLRRSTGFIIRILSRE